MVLQLVYNDASTGRSNYCHGVELQVTKEYSISVVVVVEVAGPVVHVVLVVVVPVIVVVTVVVVVVVVK